MNNSSKVEFFHAGAAVAASSSIDDASDIIDMQGCDSVVFIAAITDSVATGVASLEIEQNSVNSTSGMTALSGAVATKTCVVNDDLNNKLLVVEVYKPAKQFIRAKRTSATANIAFGDLVVLKTGSKVLPVTQGADVLAATLSVSPDESA